MLISDSRRRRWTGLDLPLFRDVQDCAGTEFSVHSAFTGRPERGVVYYANYLKFMERADGLAAGARDRSKSIARRGAAAFAVVSVAVDFLLPAILMMKFSSPRN